MSGRLYIGLVVVVTIVAALVVPHGSWAQRQPVASIALPEPGSTVQLYPGCNNITLTFAGVTSSEAVVQAVTPPGVVESIWRHDAAEGKWDGYSPAFPEVASLLTVNFLDAVWLCVAGAAPAPTATPPEAAADFSRIMFLHHSCGAALIEQGGVRQRLTGMGYEFYDHGYNDEGLVLADGTWTGESFDVPGDNTDPDGYANIFAQPLHDPPDNTFSYLMQYDVIAFKSCFPVSYIESDEQLADYRSYYLSIRDRMDQYPNKIFIVVTQPPQVPNETDAEVAARARAFTDWLASNEYLSGHPNVFTFNFFDLLADPSDNMLRAEYRADEWDSHPNELANQTIGPLFANFIDQSVRTYTGR